MWFRASELKRKKRVGSDLPAAARLHGRVGVAGAVRPHRTGAGDVHDVANTDASAEAEDVLVRGAGPGGPALNS